MSIDFDPIIADLVGKSRYPVIKLSSGLYAAVSAITDSGATTKQIYYGDEIGGLPAEVKIYGTVTQWHQDMMEWVAGAPEYHEVG